MQLRPSAHQLLTAVADLLDERVIAGVDTALTHEVRVAAHLVRVVAREIGAGSGLRERRRLGALLGDPLERDVHALRAELADRLVSGLPMPDAELARVHAALVATVCEELAVNKPGYSAWEHG